MTSKEESHSKGITELQEDVDETQMESDDPLVGQKIGKYSIVDRVAKGGTAVVYRAVDEVLNREVAFKVLHEHLEKRSEVVERFKNEARVVASLRHNNIVNVFDFITENDKTVLVVEYVPGMTLSELVRRYNRISEEYCLMLAVEILNGLQAAHEKGITHRDIKPANILLSKDYGVKISDFGLAKLINQDDGLTKEGVFIGTPSFSSPEQIEGKPMDHRTDIFSLGLTLYLLVTGRHAFKAKGDSTTTVWFKIVRGQFKGVREINESLSEDFEKILSKALAVSPDDRYSSAKEMAEAALAILEKRKSLPYQDRLKSFLEHPESAGELELEPIDKQKSKSPWIASLMTLLVAAMGAVYFYWTQIQNQSEPATPPVVMNESEEGDPFAGVSPESIAVNEPADTRPLPLEAAPPSVAFNKVAPRQQGSASAASPTLAFGKTAQIAVPLGGANLFIFHPQDSGFALRFEWSNVSDQFALAQDAGFRRTYVEEAFRDRGFDWENWRAGEFFYRVGSKRSELVVEDLESYRTKAQSGKRDLVVTSEFDDVELQFNPWQEQIRLLWPTGPDAQTYRLELAEDRAFQNVIFAGNFSVKSASIERNWTKNQEVFWKISYRDESGNVFFVDPTRRLDLKIKGHASQFDIMSPAAYSDARGSFNLVSVGPARSENRCRGFPNGNFIDLKKKGSFFAAQITSDQNWLLCESKLGVKITRVLYPLRD